MFFDVKKKLKITTGYNEHPTTFLTQIKNDVELNLITFKLCILYILRSICRNGRVRGNSYVSIYFIHFCAANVLRSHENHQFA